tara:strand:- start:1445 stop:1942 length:498 start_codon:yes stop_codon:yes gene_type:complete
MIAATLRPYLWAAALALIAVALWAAYSRGVSTERGRWQLVQAKEARARAAQQKANDAETVRRLTTQKEIAENAIRERDAARDDAVAAGAAGERLRAQIRNLTLSLASRDPGAAGSSETAASSINMLAIVQQRLDERADGLARYADEAAVAGRACEASYEALRAGK